jgi:hypothetical protein
MDNFIDQALDDLDNLINKILNNRYLYIYIHDNKLTNNINNIINRNDIGSLISYVKLLFEGNENNSKLLGPLGDKFFLESKTLYKDTYLDNNNDDNDDNIHRQSKYVIASNINGLEPGHFNNTNSKLEKHYQKYFTNKISEKELNLSDISACLYFISLIFTGIYIITKCKKCK